MKRLRMFLTILAATVIITGCIGEKKILAGELAVHFIDVGQADSALLICDGKAMLIDGGNREDSSLVAAYLKKHNIFRLEYVIATHPHEDHIGGLGGALNTVKVKHVYAPQTGADTKVYDEFIDAVEAQGLEPECPEIGETVFLGDSTITFLAPVSEEVEDVNDTSIVCKVEYGDSSFLFTGDAERISEEFMIESRYDLRADVLKVGHHGSANSSTYPFLREVMPEYAVISVGEGNDYGHPTEAALSRLRDAGAEVYRTDLQGDIVATTNGRDISFTASKNASVQTVPEKGAEEAGVNYIGNIRGKKFHKTTCSGLPDEKNRVYLSSRSEAIEKGYSPCGRCIGK